ncbi:glycosyltransferase family protein [Magnetospirillum moscoviense]|uniref:Spore protein YkvP/CgeB glycosyl transferase-like domain-containing protein n=1 Tax=Magnetospirillum moscoviense TaxID=1437059 RepID=A0A178MS62_9PROT|nr:glycosyltransferase [Magnetospirillum moscoviense]OAN50774.1 hypothetical protein A6A05_11680 [Magnetospirillum moscoviense]
MIEDTAAGRWYLAAFPSGTSGRTMRVMAAPGLADSPRTWCDLAENLYFDGLGEAGAIVALKAALALYPGDLDLVRALAETEYRTGAEAAARDRLAPLADQDAAAAILLLTFDRQQKRLDRAVLMRAADLVLNVAPWGAVHEDFIQLCRDGGVPELGVQFLSAWLTHRGMSLWPYLRAGELMLEAGELAGSARVLLDLWGRNPTATELVGPWTGIPDDDAATEARILDEIEHAFASPDEDLPVHPLPDCARDPADVTVLYLGAEQASSGVAAANDLAGHFAAAARAAGGRFIPWLDSTLSAVRIGPCSDSELCRRKEAFLAELERVRPDILLCDSQTVPGLRFPTVPEIRELKARLGFKLVHVSRDSLRAVDNQMQLWADVADHILLFDPCAYVLRDPEHRDLAAKAFAIPVPAVHPPFVPSGRPPQHQLLFVGSTFAPHRSFLLAGLASADIGLELVIGEKRRQLAPDDGAYAGLLASSRAVLNVAAHAAGESGRLVTGRVWETIASGSLLVEQLHEGTARFFQPWRHFIPWSEPADIIKRWRVLSRHEDVRARIAAEAHGWAQRHYGVDKVWRAIIAHALG